MGCRSIGLVEIRVVSREWEGDVAAWDWLRTLGLNRTWIIGSASITANIGTKASTREANNVRLVRKRLTELRRRASMRYTPSIPSIPLTLTLTL